MFAEMRTGSNFLEANLNALSGVTCHGEVFNPHFIGKKDQTEMFGVDLALREQTGLSISVANEPLNCVALGTGKALEYEKQLRHVIDYDS